MSIQPTILPREKLSLGADVRIKAEQDARIKRYFKDDEVYLTEKELLRRQRKFALDKQFLFKLKNMCNRVKELRQAFEEAERLE